MPLMDGLRVVMSAIHGYGVVTTRPFKQGERICFGDGVLYRRDADFDDTYALIVDGEQSGSGEDVFWDLVDQTRWFNHSCDPNCDVESKWDAEHQLVIAWWVARRDIATGEEITYDYAFVAEAAEPCACGTVKCRGLIVDDDPAELARLPDHLRAQLKPSIRAAS
ncbi:MAG: nuclear protein [Myxococcales bacterium]|nr:nuclear protein [Myxococcales bacterium]